MGLRDRGYVLDYYMPLFAGADQAKRSRFRTRYPFALLAPYFTGGGTSTPGGLGSGDGGMFTPIDYSIQTPVITSPADEATAVCPGDSAVSSAFTSDNGQTHVASRWLIELLAADGTLTTEGTGMFVLDSGPRADYLTSGPLSLAGLQRGSSYRIQVRYKGSDGGWSDWSLPVSFVMATCTEACAGDLVSDPAYLWTSVRAASGSTITEDGELWSDTVGSSDGEGHSGVVLAGKVYAEFVCEQRDNDVPTGIGIGTAADGTFYNAGRYTIYSGAGGCGLGTSGTTKNGAIATNAAYRFEVGDVIGVAVDATAGKLWFSKNGTWLSGDPAADTSPTATFTPGSWYFYVGVYGCPAGGASVRMTAHPALLAHDAPTGFSAYQPV